MADNFKKFRESLSEQNLPRLKKSIRLAYEHLEEHQDFNIPIPEDKSIEEVEETEEGEEKTEDVENEEVENSEETVVAVEVKMDITSKLESLNYLVSLMEDSTHKLNASELKDFILLFEAYQA